MRASGRRFIRLIGNSQIESGMLIGGRSIRYEESTLLFQGFLHLGCSIILLKQVYG
jgi:hypothetical protein